MQPVGVRALVIDRIEGSLAVVEVAKGELKDVPIASIAGRARDGAVIIEGGDGYIVDEDATRERFELVAERRRRMFGQ